MAKGICMGLGLSVLTGLVAPGLLMAQGGTDPIPLSQLAPPSDFILLLDPDEAEARAQAAQPEPRPEDFLPQTTDTAPLVPRANRAAEIPPVQTLQPNWAIGVYR